jgi:tetratricopeptide (TPR) repeat protein
MQLTVTYTVDHKQGKEVSPADMPAKLQRARTLHHEGELAQAKVIYEEILITHAKHSEVLNLLGLIAAQTNNLQLAANLIDRAIECDPYNVEAHCNKGTLLRQLNQWDAALICFNQAIAIDNNLAAAYLNRGLTLQELQQLDAALASCDRAIEINPDFAEAHCGRGVVLQELQQLDAALASCDRAIEINPDFAEAHHNRGNVLMELGLLDAALVSLNQAIAIDPNLAAVHWVRSMTLLLLGDYDSGWPEYEWRWKVEKISPFKEQRSFQQPLWLGRESIAGKTVLLYAERGLGDTIQFCRYAKMVAALGARVILEVPDALAVLLSNLEGVSQVVTTGSTLPAFDYQCPLMTLPLAFKTTIESIPSSSKYLVSDAIKVAQWQTKLAGLVDKTQPLIGLAWSGNPRNTRDRYRSIRFAELIQHLPRNCQYITLQKEVSEVDRAALVSNPHVLDFPSDFSDTAALCECLDLVISVDTSLAHLSGALGKRTWLLLPFSPDWRWLLDRDDSPWYRQLKLYRQKQIGDWNGVLNQVSSDLLQSFNIG